MPPPLHAFFAALCVKFSRDRSIDRRRFRSDWGPKIRSLDLFTELSNDNIFSTKPGKIFLLGSASHISLHLHQSGLGMVEEGGGGKIVTHIDNGRRVALELTSVAIRVVRRH